MGDPERMAEVTSSKTDKQASGHRAHVCLFWPFSFPACQQSRSRERSGGEGRRWDGGAKEGGTGRPCLAAETLAWEDGALVKMIEGLATHDKCLPERGRVGGKTREGEGRK